MYYMNKELIIRSGSEVVDFALLKDGKLIELHKEEEKGNDFQVGDIFIAKIRKPKLTFFNEIHKTCKRR
jgi:ribonuclease G